jgi:AcrR family transcriptional regulator
VARGVARVGVREQLFAAVDRIVARDGVAGVTSRAVTDEAGCAKGLLHNHFDGLDGFLTEFALDRLTAAVAQLSGLSERVGHGAVIDNLTDAAVGLFGSGAVTVAALLAARPTLAARVAAATETASITLGAVEQIFTGYLAAERELGRVPTGTDVDVVAFTLIGAVHHLFATRRGTDMDQARVRQIAATLLHS